jgi:hypothetical protein
MPVCRRGYVYNKVNKLKEVSLMREFYVKIIKVGEAPKEIMVEEGSTIGEALTTAGIRNADSFHARYLNSTTVVPFSTEIDGDTTIILTKKESITGGR